MTEESETIRGSEEWPLRPLRDAATVRALAHPLRIRLVELLAVHGPATATELAERVGHSPANCSWHLRQLAASGFIEEAEGGTGRQRIWKFVPRGSSYRSQFDDPELTEASDSASAIRLEYEVGELRTWNATRHTEPPQWRDAGFNNDSILWLTPEELNELGDKVLELYLRNVRRHFEPETRPEGARPVRLVAWGFPDKNLETDE